ncbi:terminase large subunit domain-containing protein [Streptomyces sp. NPDC050485]|uniref:terminase large subunit domain-containing protein n=1 Tax=Streptomyces sp. NPDC050485 TaxID=3365617 RepID=UPI00378F29C1
MPWQHYVSWVALEIDPSGIGFRYPEVLVTVPRQSGKTTLLRPVMTHRSLMLPDAATWMTAQKRNDARDTWLTTVKHVERSPLAGLATVRRANGSERITFANGGQLGVFAPSTDALHGKYADLVFVDEIWAFLMEQGTALTQALVPTQATRPWAQTWYVSTAGTGRSAWMRAMVERGREDQRTGRPTRLAYFDWSIPPDCTDLTDLQIYADHHPALGHTIGMRALEQAAETLAPGEFARAFGNFWVSSDTFVIAPALWDGARTAEKLAPGSPIAFAAEVHADRSGGVIVAAGRVPDGRSAVEVIEGRGGVGWIAPRLLELVRRHRPVAVVVDAHGPAGTVHAALSEQRAVQVPLIPISAGDVVQAHAEFRDQLTAGTLAHRPDETGRLDAALSAAQTRLVREQEVVSRLMAEDGSSPAALIAAELAAYGLTHPGEQTPAPRLIVVGT